MRVLSMAASVRLVVLVGALVGSHFSCFPVSKEVAQTKHMIPYASEKMDVTLKRFVS